MYLYIVTPVNGLSYLVNLQLDTALMHVIFVYRWCDEVVQIVD